jgi:hypothetical protein
MRRDLDQVVARIRAWSREACRETVVYKLTGIRSQKPGAKDRSRRRAMKRLETAGGEREGVAARQAD